MNWKLLPQLIVTGLLNGGPIALNALGLVLIFKSSKIFNFSHGHFLMFGAFSAWWFAIERGLPLWLSILLALAVAVVMGLLVERFTLRPLIGQPLLSIILMTLAMSQLIQGMALVLFSAEERPFPPLFTGKPYLFDFAIGQTEYTIRIIQGPFWIFVSAMAAVVLFSLFFRYSRMGLAMRATSEDHELAQSVGLKVHRIFGAAWAIAGMTAVAGGILLASQSGVRMGLSVFILKAFPAVLLGGLESIPGAIVGGLIIGLAEQLMLGLPRLQVIRSMWEITPYILLLIVLVIRPEGLFGEKRIERI